MERLHRDLKEASLSTPVPPSNESEKESVQKSPSLSRTKPVPTHVPQKPLNSDLDLQPVSPLSEEDIKIHINGEVSTSSGDDDETFTNSVAAPCPYIDFVPLTAEKDGGGGGGKTDVETSKEVESGELSLETGSSGDQELDDDRKEEDVKNEKEEVYMKDETVEEKDETVEEKDETVEKGETEEKGGTEETDETEEKDETEVKDEKGASEEEDIEIAEGV